MAITELTDDLNIVAALDDEPNDTGGLTSAQLKAKFDEAGNTIKTYINDDLIPGVEAEIDNKVAGAELASGNVPVGGTTGQALIKGSDADYDAAWGTPGDSAATPNMVVTRDASGRAQVAAPNVLGDIALMETVIGLKWDIIQSYTVAGTYTFTAPDLYGDGSDYQIGVFIIGGGGSGGAVKGISDQYQYSIACSGGASGYTKTVFITVTPENEYTVIVGAGGANVSISTSVGGVNGNSGGSSSFNGITADGGGGGYVSCGLPDHYPGVFGASGGQGSDARGHYTPSILAPANGMPTKIARDGSNTTILYGGDTYPTMCINPFTQERLLGAGGGGNVYAGYSSSAFYQAAPTLADGKSAGSGIVSTSGGHRTAGSATSVGSGGGGIGICYYAIDYSYVATSGAGAAGAVMIYTKKVVA